MPRPRSAGATRRLIPRRETAAWPSSSRSRGGGRSVILCRRFRAPPLREAAAERREKIRRGPPPAREGGVVDFEEAEPRAKTLEPLEVVDERPIEIAFDREARVALMTKDRDMFPQEGPAQPVITRRNSVFGHEDRKSGSGRHVQNAVKSPRMNFPSGVRQAAAFRIPVKELANSAGKTPKPQMSAAVVVEPEIIGSSRKVGEFERRGSLARERPSHRSGRRRFHQ